MGRKTYRTQKDSLGKRLPYRKDFICNQRRLKRLKNKVFRFFKRGFGIKTRIKTHTLVDRDFHFYGKFQTKWNAWKKENNLATAIEKHPSVIYSEMF